MTPPHPHTHSHVHALPAKKTRALKKYMLLFACLQHIRTWYRIQMPVTTLSKRCRSLVQMVVRFHEGTSTPSGEW